VRQFEITDLRRYKNPQTALYLTISDKRSHFGMPKPIAADATQIPPCRQREPAPTGRVEALQDGSPSVQLRTLLRQMAKLDGFFEQETHSRLVTVGSEQHRTL
jgi:hypothetical protein